ncbi:MAG: hypothetical protein K9J30_04045 [Bacteroidales bacterium]|nr:hypothetical protein [Bacteroidales bacterium]
MKATIKIVVMLMAMIIGTLEASAQSARRGAENKDKGRNESSASNPAIKKNNTYTKPLNQSRSVSRVNNRDHVRTDRSNNRTYINDARQKQGTEREKISTTNRHNPRSNYRKTENITHLGKTVRDPREQTSNTVHYNPTKNNRVFSGRNTGHLHYPAKRVKMYVHPSTYHNHYRVLYYPAHRDIIWTKRTHRYYVNLYPGYTWRYPVGYTIRTISVFDAEYNIGQVNRIYGRVYGTWLNRETDELLLFFGGEFPYQTFTMIVPGKIARRYSWRPERYFLGQHIIATGLITRFENKPEMFIRDRHQFDVY